MDLNFFELILIIFASYSICLVIFKIGSKILMYNQSIEYKTEKPDQDDYPPFYPNGWLPVLESISLKKNQIVPVFAFGNNLVAFRSSDGKVTVLDAYCPHLGAHLAYGGKVIDNSVKCPFHGWVYNQDGKCTYIPGINETDCLPKVQIKVWDSIEVNGIIFVWNPSKGEKPNWFPKELDNFSNLILQSTSENYINCHIQDIQENSADLVHFKELHESFDFVGMSKNSLKFLGYLDKKIYLDYKARWSVSEDAASRHISHTIARTKLIFFGLTLLWSDNYLTLIGPAHFYLKTIMKTWFTNKFEINFLVSTISTGPLSQRLIVHCYTKSSSIIVKMFAKNAASFAQIMIGRDVLMWNNKKYLSKPFFGKNEQSLKGFRSWYSQFYSFEKSN